MLMAVFSPASRRLALAKLPQASEPDENDLAADRELVAGLLAGKGQAFDVFFNRHARAVYRYAGSRIRDPDEVDEVVQATMTHALEGLARYRGNGPLAAWLVGICRFEISSRQRRRRRGQMLELDEEDPQVLDRTAAAPTTPEGPETVFGRRERTRLVHLTLDALPERYRRVLTGKYLEDLSVREVAERLATTPKAAESLLTRAREAFERLFRRISAEPTSAEPTSAPDPFLASRRTEHDD